MKLLLLSAMLLFSISCAPKKDTPASPESPSAQPENPKVDPQEEQALAQLESLTKEREALLAELAKREFQGFQKISASSDKNKALLRYATVDKNAKGYGTQLEVNVRFCDGCTLPPLSEDSLDAFRAKHEEILKEDKEAEVFQRDFEFMAERVGQVSYIKGFYQNDESLASSHSLNSQFADGGQFIRINAYPDGPISPDRDDFEKSISYEEMAKASKDIFRQIWHTLYESPEAPEEQEAPKE